MQIDATSQLNVNQSTPVTTIQPSEPTTVSDGAVPAAASTVQNTSTSTVVTGTVTNTAVNTTAAKGQLNATNTVVNLAIQNVLKELAAMLGERQNLLDSLPENIQQLVTNILENSTATDISQGFAAILKSQRISTDKISTLANVLENAAQVIGTQQAVLENLPINIKQMLTNLRTLMPTKDEISQLATKVAAELNNIVDQSVSMVAMNNIANIKVNDFLHANTTSAAGKPNGGTVLNIPSDRVFQSIVVAEDPESLIEKLITVIEDIPETAASPSSEEVAVAEMNHGTSAGKQPTIQATAVLKENILSVNDANNNLPTKLTASAAINQEQQKVSVQPQMATSAVQVTPKMIANLQAAVSLLNNPGKAFLQDVSLEFRQQVRALIENMQGQLDIFQDKKTVLPKTIEMYIDKFALSDDADGSVQNLAQLVEKAREDKTGLQQLMNTTVSFAPLFIRQAAKDSQLPNIWALLTLAHAVATEDTDDLDKASTTLKEIAVSLQKGVQASPDNGNGHTSATVSIPVCFAEGVPPYPLYIHIYHQRQYSSASNEKTKYETWLRLCLVTQHIGNVECVFRLYEDKLLDVRVNIEEQEGAASFREEINSLKEKFEQSSLTLVGITVN